MMSPKQLIDLIESSPTMTQAVLARSLEIADRQLRRYLAGSNMIPTHIAIAARCVICHSEDSAAPLSAQEIRDYNLILSLWPSPVPRAVQIAARCIVLHQHAARRKERTEQ